MGDVQNLRSEFLAHLRTEVLGRSSEFASSTGSTNDDAKRAISKGLPEGHLVCADAQEQGRGRRGRQWSSPPGEDLYFSFSVPSAWFRLSSSLDVGLGMLRGLRAIEPALGELKVKWPNDLLIGKKKCAGILVEASGQSGAVAGMGINVNRTSFGPGPFRTVPTSLALKLGRRLNRGRVLAEVLNHTEVVMRLQTAEVTRELSQELAFLGQTVNIDGTTGVVSGLTHRGGLRLKTESGEKEVLSGEVDLPNPGQEP